MLLCLMFHITALVNHVMDFQIGMEGTGLEPAVEALFGANGFFPDTAMKTIYYAADKMPIQVKQVLRNMLPSLRNDRKKRQVLDTTTTHALPNMSVSGN